MAADESYQKRQQLILFTSKPSIAIRKSRLATLVQHNVERAYTLLGGGKRERERERIEGTKEVEKGREVSWCVCKSPTVNRYVKMKATNVNHTLDVSLTMCILSLSSVIMSIIFLSIFLFFAFFVCSLSHFVFFFRQQLADGVKLFCNNSFAFFHR